MAEDDNDIWALLDDRAGNRSQALGVTARLGRPVKSVELRYGFGASLPNALLGESIIGLDSKSKSAIAPPFPKLIIAAGRRTAPVARWIKNQTGGSTKLVQIMDPGAGHSAFDLICRPRHDGPVNLPNVMMIDSAPHGVTPELLEGARADWSDTLSRVPKPRIAVLIGGSTRRRTLTDEMAHVLILSLCKVAEQAGAGLMVTTSRRTGGVVDTIAATMPPQHFLHRWDSNDENPYMGLLACADAVVVTGESVSMCAEACATGKPVYIYAPSSLISAKHARMHKVLFAGGHARLFEGDIDLEWTPESLDVAVRIAAEIQERGLLP